eukprot:6476120-Amphidinium_carterae.1
MGGIVLLVEGGRSSGGRKRPLQRLRARSRSLFLQCVRRSSSRSRSRPRGRARSASRARFLLALIEVMTHCVCFGLEVREPRTQ